MSSKEIQRLIEQLQQLQLHQQEVTNRLAILTATRVDTREVEEVVHIISAVPEPNTTVLQIGDRVKIRNPRPNQERSGVVPKIGKTNITITSASDGKIVHAPQNIIKL